MGQCRTRPVDQQFAQIYVPALADAEKLRLATGRRLTRDKAKPRHKIATALECTLGDRSPRPDRVWNRIADVVREPIIGLALAERTLSPRTLARHFADTKLFRVKGFGLSPAEGARPDRQPRFHRHEGGR